jgi:hypothetical protein
VTLLFPRVSFEIAPDPGDRGEPDVKQGRTGGSAVGEDPRLVTDGRQVLAHGAFVCPECEFPISPAPKLAPRAPYACPFCDHRAIAIDFLREDVIDTAANEVVLVARVTG